MFAGITSEDARPLLRGRRIYLRPPIAADWRPWAELRQASRAFLEPWEPIWPHDVLTRASFRRRLKFYQREAHADQTYAFLLYRSFDDRMLGGITLSNVRRGVTQSGTIGYWVGEEFTGNGYMTAAVSLLLSWAFNDLNLHRVEAACIPTNGPSRALLQKCGFTEEGYARNYLRIAGEWQDHVLHAILSTDPRPVLY